MSRRRVIFDNYQVSYFCDCLYAAESFTDTIDINMMNFFFCPDEYFRSNSHGSSASFVSMSECLEEYTKRNLTSDADSLNACLGILNSCRTNPTYNFRGHLWGVPIPRTKLMMLLDWRHVGVSKRRPNFPSWSWAGWRGSVQHETLLLPTFTNRAEINLLDPKSQSISLEKYLEEGFSHVQDHPTTAPRRLQIKGKCPSFRVVHGLSTSSFSIRYVELAFSEIGIGLYAIHVDDELYVLNDFKNCLAVVLGCRTQHRPHHYSASLLFLKPTGNTYTRIGISIINYESESPFGTAPAEPFWLQNAVERTVVVE